jgi:signal transduction histidine kinase
MSRVIPMLLRPRGAAAQVAIGVAAVALAAALREALTPVLGDRLPWATFFVAVLLSGISAGRVGALVACVGSAAVGSALYLRPVYATDPGVAAVAVLVFAATAACLAWVGVAFQELLVASREADRRKDDFLAMLAHEMRGPLGTILSSVEVARRSPESRAVEVDRIERQARALSRLAGDILDIARIRTGQVELQRARVALQAIVAEAVSATSFEGRVFRSTMPDEPLMVNADAARIAQVLANLLGNAVKFTPPEGVISVQCERGERDVVVRVRDSGVGISAEFLPRVFEPYVQGKHSHGPGIGLGLSIARRFVVLHGGHIEAFSDGPGKGAEFVVHLPAS